MRRWLEPLLFLLAFSALLAATVPWLTSLGMEYDEAHFLPTAVKLAFGAEERINPPHGITLNHRPIPFMTMPYVGSLDAFVYALPYRLFGSSPLVSRFTNLTLALAICALAWSLTRRHAGPWAALFALALLLADVELILHFPTNFGPFLLQQLLTLIALHSLQTWLHSGGSLPLLLATASLALAFHEKLTFLWILGSLLPAALLFYFRPIRQHLRWFHLPAALLLALLILSPILYFTFSVPEVVLGFGKQSSRLPTDWPTLLASRWHSLNLMLRGSWTIEFTVGPPPAYLSRGPALLLLFLLAFPAALYTRHRPALFLLSTASGIWVGNLFFPDAGRMHHVLLMAPLWQMAAAMAFFALPRKLLPLPLALALWAAADATRSYIWYTHAARATGGINHWSDMTTSLALWLQQHPDHQPVTTSWGIAHILETLSGGRLSPTELYFQTLPAQLSPETTAQLSSLIHKQRQIWLVSDVMPLYAEQWNRVVALALSQGKQPLHLKTFPSRSHNQQIAAYTFTPTPPTPARWLPRTSTQFDLTPSTPHLRLRLDRPLAGVNDFLTLHWLDATGKTLFTDTRNFYWNPSLSTPALFEFTPHFWPSRFERQLLSPGTPTSLRLESSLPPALIEVAAPDLSSLQQYPAPPRPFSSPLLGEYGNASQSVILLEHNGQLLALANRQHLTPYNPATNPVSPAGLLWHGQTLPRLPDPNRDFRIQLEQPVSALRPIADAAQPPAQPPHLLPPDLVNLRTLSPSLHFDIRYATSNNFMGAALYSQPAAYLQRPAAQALLRAHQQLASSRVGLLIHDAYRPWRVTRMFWDATPHHQRNFVANPARGSRHNRGCAVDLSLYDLQSGQPLTMPSGFDEFSPRAYPDYPGGSSLERFHRGLLRRAMEQQGFTVNDDEWWHFDYQDWQRYPILNLSFEQLGSR